MRCEGRRRHGGAFTLGPAVWEQCRNEAVVWLALEGCESTPACTGCWREVIASDMPILYAVPVAAEDDATTFVEEGVVTANAAGQIILQTRSGYSVDLSRCVGAKLLRKVE